IIIALVPTRLLLMNRLWPKETLSFVDAWACRKGTPEDVLDHAESQADLQEETFGLRTKGQEETAAV
ncbi:hypothetical protein MMC14_006732, partial [Varicellaria rhodocarpa]|nr:hypothetical protein [Varicellaria rhodocarpa]